MPQYDEIEIEDMTYDPKTLTYSYPCPCGDRFRVTLEDLWDGEDIADCQSCTLYIQVIYEQENLPPLPNGGDDENDDDEKNAGPIDDDGDKKQDEQEEEKKENQCSDDAMKEKDGTFGMGKLSLDTPAVVERLHQNEIVNPAVAT
jgi:diphthamide biosynthesis protein 3